jgi:hypothetical protein
MRCFATWAVAVTLLAATAGAETPAVPARAADHVIVLMLDGVRPDTLRRVHAPNVAALGKAGTTFWRATATYPSQTRVSFVTVPTGSYPDGHGITGGDEFKTPDWQTVVVSSDEPEKFQHLCMRPTMFEEATAAGLTSMYAAMKGYELVGGRGVTYPINGKKTIDPLWYGARYDDNTNGSRELSYVDKMALSRDLLEQSLVVFREHRPNLSIINLGSADYMAHTWGPDSPEYNRAIEAIDGLIGRLLAELDKMGIRQRTAIIVSSDHGFTQISPDRVIAPLSDRNGSRLDFLEAAGIEHYASNTGGTSVALYIRDKSRVKDAVASLRKQPWAEGVYCEDKAASCDRTLSSLRLHYPGRSPEIMVDVDDDVALNRPRPGNHGSLRATDLRVPFIMSGAGVGAGRTFGDASLVDIAPTALRLLGLKPKLMKADGRVLEEALAP